MVIMKTAKAAKNTGIVHLSVAVFKTLYRSYPLFLNFLSPTVCQWPTYFNIAAASFLMGTVAVAAVAASMRQERFRQTERFMVAKVLLKFFLLSSSCSPQA
jgi:hypothetical protein